MKGSLAPATGTFPPREKKSGRSFTSAIRVVLMLYYRDAATSRAGEARVGAAVAKPDRCRRKKSPSAFIGM